ncbi:group I intron-associated PD-(D/E)XK endonuclease [Paenibacillus sp. FSL K6-2859]|uniref:group I intron-associated PD-(D/E)XK endonuclease n=1 Tax=Paenibacillus sp. FSL K6-2859 TaxID=2921482 RepID=UPI0030FAEBCA
MEWRSALGASAECNVMLDVLESGFEPLSPRTATSTFDLVVEGLRIQIKRGDNTGTNLKADIRRPSAKCRKYTAEEVDVFAVVDPISRRVAYVHRAELVHERHLTLYLTRDHTRKGLPTSYKAQYFDDYIGFHRVLQVARNNTGRVA